MPKKRTTSLTARSGLAKAPRFNRPAAIILASLLAALGVYVLFRSHASSPPPPAGGYFTTLAPGSTLPSDSVCASQVHRSAWEPRPENTTANYTIPSSVSIPGYTPQDGGVDQRARALADRVDGKFTGTTDEIVQWAACKWGFSDEIVRAVAVNESWWKQSAVGDIINDQTKCQSGYTAPCPQSFGLVQVKATQHPGTFAWSRDSTAFNLDYALLYRRVCFEGWTNWLKSSYPSYAAGDEWGCVGQWGSGGWYDATAQNYISTVKGFVSSKPWLGWPDQSTTDTSAPTVPSGLIAQAASASQINLSWNSSTDNVGVSGYDIYRNNLKLATVASNSYSDIGLSAATGYSYFVVARDAADNTSPASNVVSATTASGATGDSSAPLVTISAPAAGTKISGILTVSASASDNVGVTKMQIYFDSTLKSQSSSSSIRTSFGTRKFPTGTHTITVKAYDAAGNVGQSSLTVYK